jgi:hypothetical protein
MGLVIIIIFFPPLVYLVVKMVALSIAEQRKLVKAIPRDVKAKLKTHLRAYETQMAGQGGAGLFDFIKKAGKFLVKHVGPIVKKVAPFVLQEVILPLVKKKAGLGRITAGGGLTLAGASRSRGRGLTLAGSGVRVAGGARKKTVRRKR